ncbi:MAG: signal peptidase II [Ignavibacteriaceae bacterium]|nr:signal peptidase II [Ignavibacteriaceae bacterium]
MKLLFVSFLILLADQVSKFYVKGFYLPLLGFEHSGLPQSRSIPVIDKLLYITPIENPGIAFGIDFGPEFKTIISVVTIIATLALAIYFFSIKKEDMFIRFSVAVILGGAMGNLIDRVFYGYIFGYASILSGNVVDFLDLRLFSFFLMNKTFSIYVFNIADIAITFGVFALLYAISKKRKEIHTPETTGVENTLSVD